jgi:hypothetical protein
MGEGMSLEAGILRIALAVAALSSVADASPAWHAGLDIRGDLGAHPIRAGGGARFGCIDTLLVLDPMFWTDGQNDIDALAYIGQRWSFMGGWRTSTIGLVGGTQYQEKLMLGVAAPLPDLGAHIRSRFSFELATLVVKHGGDLPSEWISFATGRDFIDLVNIGMFVTVEYASR